MASSIRVPLIPWGPVPAPAPPATISAGPRFHLEVLGAVAATVALGLWVNTVLLDAPGGLGADKGTDRQPTASPSATLAGTPEKQIAYYVGTSKTHASDVHFKNPPKGTDLTAHDVQWDGRPFKTPIYYGLRAQRWSPSSPFGTMIDFTHAKAISQRDQDIRFSGTRNGRPAPASAKSGDTFKHFEFSHGHNMLTLNGLMRLAPISPLLQPYVGAGFGGSLPHTEIQFLDDPDRTYEYQFTGPVGQAVAGLEIRLARVSLFVEYKFSFAAYSAPLTGRDSRFSYGPDDFWAQLKDWWQGKVPAYGQLTTKLATHHLATGIALRTPSGAVSASP